MGSLLFGRWDSIGVWQPMPLCLSVCGTAVVPVCLVCCPGRAADTSAGLFKGGGVSVAEGGSEMRRTAVPTERVECLFYGEEERRELGWRGIWGGGGVACV